MKPQGHHEDFGIHETGEKSRGKLERWGNTFWVKLCFHCFIFLIFRITRGELGKFALMGELILEASVNPSSEQVLQDEGRCLSQILTLKPKPRCDNIGWGKLCVLDHKGRSLWD